MMPVRKVRVFPFARLDERQGKDMAGEQHGAEETQGQQAAQEGQQQQEAAQGKQEMSDSGASGDDSAGDGYKRAIAERDERITALEAQVAEAAKSVEAAEKLSQQIDELKAQSASDRIDFELRLAGVRNVKATRAVLDDHGGDIAKLKEAEPWLFGKHAAQSGEGAGGTTGLPNAGAATDSGRQMKRWREIAGLDDSKDNDTGK